MIVDVVTNLARSVGQNVWTDAIKNQPALQGFQQQAAWPMPSAVSKLGTTTALRGERSERLPGIFIG